MIGQEFEVSKNKLVYFWAGSQATIDWDSKLMAYTNIKKHKLGISIWILVSAKNTPNHKNVGHLVGRFWGVYSPRLVYGYEWDFPLTLNLRHSFYVPKWAFLM